VSAGAESFAVILKDVVCLSVKSHTAAGPIQNYVLVFGPAPWYRPHPLQMLLAEGQKPSVAPS